MQCFILPTEKKRGKEKQISSFLIMISHLQRLKVDNKIVKWYQWKVKEQRIMAQSDGGGGMCVCLPVCVCVCAGSLIKSHQCHHHYHHCHHRHRQCSNASELPLSHLYWQIENHCVHHSFGRDATRSPLSNGWLNTTQHVTQKEQPWWRLPEQLDKFLLLVGSDVFGTVTIDTNLISFL